MQQEHTSQLYVTRLALCHAQPHARPAIRPRCLRACKQARKGVIMPGGCAERMDIDGGEMWGSAISLQHTMSDVELLMFSC
jgi:hypothetical protein